MSDPDDRIDHYDDAMTNLGEESEYEFINRSVLESIHDAVVDRYGGSYGLRDESALESAVQAPMMVDNYQESAGLASVTAALVYRVINNHPFIDGNKRTGLMALDLSLIENGETLTVSQVDVRNVVRDVAGGRLDEDGLAGWIRRNSTLGDEPTVQPDTSASP